MLVDRTGGGLDSGPSGTIRRLSGGLVCAQVHIQALTWEIKGFKFSG